MHLLQLPNELLHLVATYFDLNSLRAFMQTNRQLRDIARGALTSVKLERVSRGVLRYLYVNRTFIRALDLSDCERTLVPVWEVIREFRQLTKLNMGSLTLSSSCLLDILEDLRDLRKLSCVLSTYDFDFMRTTFGPFRSIKELHIETCPKLFSFKFIVDVMNQCTAIEVSHIHLRGMEVISLTGALPPLLAAERWNTLHTFVCSLNLAQRQTAHKTLLRSIFAHKSTPELQNWIDRDKEYYIYEHGHLNRNASANIVFDSNVELLKRIRCIDFSDVHYDREIFNWGRSASLRITCFNRLLTQFNITDLPYYFSAGLVELDLTESHGAYPANFRVNLLTLSPSLQVLAVSLCLFIGEDTRTTPQDFKRMRRSDPFTEALQKLKLKKLFLKGKCGVTCNDSTSSYIYGTCACVLCKKCGMKLTSEDLVQLRDLKHLEEMCFNGVQLADSAYDHMANSRLHTVRLNLGPRSSFHGLRRFILRCDRLRNLKLEILKSRGLPLQFDFFWEALILGRNLKKLCLSTSVITPEETRSIKNFLPEVGRSLEFIHLHALGDLGDLHRTVQLERDELCRNWPDAKIIVSTLAENLTEERIFRLDARGVNFIHEHSLCCLESFVGLVKPLSGIANTADLQKF